MTVWNSKSYNRASAIIGSYLQLAAQGGSPAAHAREPVTSFCLCRIKPFAVVGELHHQPGPIQPEFNIRFGAGRVADDVVDALLEYQKCLTAHIGPELHVLLRNPSAKVKFDVAAGK